MNNIKEKIFEFLKKALSRDRSLTSRKYRLALLIFFAATLMCAVPPVLSVFVFKMTAPLLILTGTEWVSVVTLLGGFYFGANVVQKKFVSSPVVLPPEDARPLE